MTQLMVTLALGQASGINWAGVLGFGITLAIQVVSFVWLLAKMHSRIEAVRVEMLDHKTIPERVAKIEWEIAASKESLAELKIVNIQIANKLNEMNLALHSVKDWVDSQKQENK